MLVLDKYQIFGVRAIDDERIPNQELGVVMKLLNKCVIQGV
jgi:hypothetical protein